MNSIFIISFGKNSGVASRHFIGHNHQCIDGLHVREQ